MRECRIGTLDCTRPEPSNNGEFLADERFEIAPFVGHLRRDLDWWIQLADALLSLCSHPYSIAAHVFREACRTRPSSRKVESFAPFFSGQRRDRSTSCKL